MEIIDRRNFDSYAYAWSINVYEHITTAPIPYSNIGDEVRAMLAWGKEELGYKIYRERGDWYFITKDDAIAFKLRWN